MAQLCDATAKLVDAVMAVTVVAAPPVFVIVSTCAGAVVFIDCPPKSREAGVVEMIAGAFVTTTPLLVPVIELVTVSVAVIVHVPTDFRVADAVAAPAVKVVLAAGEAASGSVLVKRAVPA